jgi:hypothetical protein
MDDKSTTAGNDPQNGDATADSTTTKDSTTATDNQPADKGDNLDPSKSTDDATATADGDKKPADGDADKSGDGGNDTPASTFDSDIDDWAAKRGFPAPENDDQRAAYQTQRNEQREYTRTRQAEKDASDLGSAVKGVKDENKPADNDDPDADPLEKRQTAVEQQLAEERTTRLQSEFYTTNQVTTDQHKAILDVFKEKVSRPSTEEGKRAALDYWGSPDALPDLLDIAKARIANSADTTVVADEAARQEREKIARESNANSTSRNAKGSPSEKTQEDQRNERLLKKYS